MFALSSLLSAHVPSNCCIDGIMAESFLKELHCFYMYHSMLNIMHIMLFWLDLYLPNPIALVCYLVTVEWHQIVGYNVETNGKLAN